MKFVTNLKFDLFLYNFSLQEPLYPYTGKLFCHIGNFMSVLGVVQTFTGGIGIALLRILFIQCSSQISGQGQRITAIVIGAVTTATTILVSFIWSTSPKKSMDYTSLCLGRSIDFHITLFEYSSDHSLTYDLRLVIYSLIIWALFNVLAELAIYISIFTFLLKHDRKMVNILPESNIRGRIRSSH